MTVSAVFTPTFNVPPCSPALPDALVLDFLGGAIGAISILPTPETLLTRALRSCQIVTPGLAAQAPVLALLQAVAAIKDFSLGLPANVAQAPVDGGHALEQSASNLEAKLVNVVAMTNPAFAFGKQLLSLIRLLRMVLQGLKAEVIKRVSLQTDLTSRLAAAAALGNAALQQQLQCEQQRMTADVALLNMSVSASIGPLIAFANVLLCLILGHGVAEMPAIPLVGALTSGVEAVFDPPLAALDAIEAAVGPFAGSGASFGCP